MITNVELADVLKRIHDERVAVFKALRVPLMDLPTKEMDELATLKLSAARLRTHPTTQLDLLIEENGVG